MRMQEGLGYPFRADRPTDLFAVGTVLGLAVAILARFAVALYPLVFWIPALALAAVPAVALLGYLLRAFAATVEGSETPPAFGSPAGLLKDGVRALVVSLVLIGGVLVSAMTHYFVTRAQRRQVPAEYQRRDE